MSDRNYKILGLKPGASKAQVKEAYRKLAKRWHPDQFAQDAVQRQQAEEKIKLINEAYRQLKDGPASQVAHSFEDDEVKVEFNTRAAHPKEFYEKAAVLAEEGKYPEAAEALSIAIRIDHTYVDAYRYRGFIYSLLGYELRAEADLRKADELKISTSYAATYASEDSSSWASSPEPAKASGDQDEPSNTSEAYESWVPPEPRPPSAFSVELSCEFTFFDSPSPLNCVSVSPNSRFMAAGGQDGVIYLWNFKTRKLFHMLRGHDAPVRTLLFAEDSQLLFSGGQDGRIKLWHMATGSLVKTFASHTGSVESLAISSLRKLLVSASLDGTVCVWNLKEGTLMRKVLDQKAPIHTFALTREGEIAICGVGDGSVQQCHILLGRVRKWANSHRTEVTSVALAEGGRYFASSSLDGKTLLWNYLKNDVCGTFEPTRSRANALSFASLDTVLLGAEEHGFLRVWEVETGNLVCEQSAHSESVQGLFVLPGTDSFVTVSTDTTIKLWKMGKKASSYNFLD